HVHRAVLSPLHSHTPAASPPPPPSRPTALPPTPRHSAPPSLAASSATPASWISCTSSSGRDSPPHRACRAPECERTRISALSRRSEEHTSELQSPDQLVCRLLLEKEKN